MSAGGSGSLISVVPLGVRPEVPTKRGETQNSTLSGLRLMRTERNFGQGRHKPPNLIRIQNVSYQTGRPSNPHVPHRTETFDSGRPRNHFLGRRQAISRCLIGALRTGGKSMLIASSSGKLAKSDLAFGADARAHIQTRRNIPIFRIGGDDL